MLFYYFDIIEQFDLNAIIKYWKDNPQYLLSNLMYLSIFLLILYFFVTGRKYGFYNMFYTAISKILTKYLGEKFMDNYLFCSPNLVFFYLLFLYIAQHNLSSIVPETLTITALLLLPVHVAFTFFIAAFFIALENTGYQWPKSFVPFGVPVRIAPFLAVIEVLSYFIRLFSLTIRLFINLLAGHILFKIFTIIMHGLYLDISGELLSSPLLTVVIFLYVFLEISAALLQAIVLTSLSAIYINESASLAKNVVSLSKSIVVREKNELQKFNQFK